MSQTTSERGRFARWRIDRAVHRVLAVAHQTGAAEPFLELLGHVRARSDLLRPASALSCGGAGQVELVLRGLVALAQYRRLWLRPVAEWVPPCASPREQFASLARHLLATHPVPSFLTRVWFEEPSQKTREHRRLYVHIARGHAIRGFPTPIPLTRAMSRFFGQAPAHLSVEQAIRWCQVRGLGGDAPLADAVAPTHLGNEFRNETYWSGVLKALVVWPELETALVAPIVEFLRRHPQHAIPKASDRPPAFRQFSARVKNWMVRVGVFHAPPQRSWAPQPIRSFEYLEPRRHAWSERAWTIHELTDSAELIEEGRELRHCVAAYAGVCAKGTSSIWSLRCHTLTGSRRVLTIEVNPFHRMIVQARGRRNTWPEPKARALMEEWARVNNLTLRWARRGRL
jgi:PcfJ-like protein